ncbi:hypothetical protein [Paenibacillus humicola]|uniref:hypothetical protein n=1 Tax=Paenibacillus humicola TaxID=3110540 RepID=UPI00237AD248|nr:hypothetical protein [Paenibacillus humicola]
MKLVNKVALFSSACVLALAIGGSAGAMAAPVENVSPSTETEIVPYVNWTGSAYITTNAYSNITSSNNFFNDSPLVTNSANSPGTITVRILDSKGAQVGSTKTIAAGKSVRLDQIPWNSGTYTLQGKGSVSGTYYISID